MKTLILASLLALAGPAMAAPAEIPTDEHTFVDNIYSYDKAAIVEQFGEPSKKSDITDGSNEVIASVWHYHFVNTTDDGAYYPTTELDFVGDKVVTVVFMNNDGEDTPDTVVKSRPSREPDL